MVLDHDSAPVCDTHWKFKLPPTCCMAPRVAALPRLIIISTSVLYHITHQIKKNSAQVEDHCNNLHLQCYSCLVCCMRSVYNICTFLAPEHYHFGVDHEWLE